MTSLTLRARAVTQYAGAAAEVMLAEREGEAALRPMLRRAVQDTANDDRVLLAGIAECGGCRCPRTSGYEPAWKLLAPSWRSAGFWSRPSPSAPLAVGRTCPT